MKLMRWSELSPRQQEQFLGQDPRLSAIWNSGWKQGMTDAAHELMVKSKHWDRPTVYLCHDAIIKARDAQAIQNNPASSNDPASKGR